MHGVRSYLRGGIARAIVGSILFFALAGGAALRERKLETRPVRPTSISDTQNAADIPASVRPRPAALPQQAAELRVDYENLLLRGQEIQSIVMRASLDDLEDPNGEYQRRMREYGQMWAKYQSNARRLRSAATAQSAPVAREF
jgi:hypothetical protein